MEPNHQPALIFNQLDYRLVVFVTPLKNMSSSIGMMTFPIYGKIKNGTKPPTSLDIQPTRLPVGGFCYPSEKYEFVNWDDDIPNIWENKKWQPNHQPALIFNQLD